MPVDQFVPLIGSGFDALAGQRQFWNNFSANVENQNIARANAAEQTYNDWLQRTASLQRADQELNRRDADTAAQRAISALATQAANAESKREFDVNTQLAREQAKEKLDLQKSQEQEAKNLLDSSAEALAPDLQDAHEKFLDAESKLNETQRAMTTDAQDKLAALPATERKMTTVGRNGLLVPLDPRMALGPEASSANRELVANHAGFNDAKTEYAAAQKAYQEAQKQVLTSKLQIITHADEEGNSYPVIRNPFTNKYFGVKKGGKKPATPVAEDIPAPTGPPRSFEINAPPTDYPLPFNWQTYLGGPPAELPAAPPPPAGALTIGRFKVIPQ